MTIPLACQEQLLPGTRLTDKYALAVSLGYQGIELRGRGDLALARRLPELRRARAEGVVMPTVCVEMDHFIGDFDPARSRDAVRNLRSQLSVIAELGGIGAMTPAAWGMFSRRLPPFEPPRPPEGDRQVLVDTLGELGEHARAEGVALFLEPLNQPGAGHLDWPALLGTLDDLGYAGWLALECRLRGEPVAALRQAAAVLGPAPHRRAAA